MKETNCIKDIARIMAMIVENLDKDDFEEDSRFRVMNSMRSVETPVQVIARE